MSKEAYDEFFDEKSFKYWEDLLSDEGLSSMDVGSTIVVEQNIIDNVLDENFSFTELLYKFQNEKNISIDINFLKKSLSIINKFDNDLIGEIYISEYKDGNFIRPIHLYNVIDEKYRGKGFGQIMLSLYEKLSFENSDFIMPDEEYSDVVSMINIYKKFGYTPKYKIINGIDNPIDVDIEDILLINRIVDDYKKGIKEDKLPFTVILEKT